VIIDNDSTDHSPELFSTHAHDPVIAVERLPFQGYFSLYEQLEAKQRVYEKINHDWVIHLDADEILEHSKPGLTLRDAIQDAHESGFNALNFEEFVLLPDSNEGVENYYTDTLRYYFFEPRKMRLNRAWRRDKYFESKRYGGHHLAGDHLAVCPTNHVLRHYIVLSYEHAKTKYLARTFGEKDLSMGWHGKRMNFTESNLQIPDDSPFLFQLSRFDSKDFHRASPVTRHYWEWER
jgi:hypothetical protein